MITTCLVIAKADVGSRWFVDSGRSLPTGHSRVVNALMAGVPVPMIQKQVGHKRLSTTEIYATVAPALVKEAYDLHGFGPENGVSSGD